MTGAWRLVPLVLILATHAVPSVAQTITVRESAGIRRTQFPVTAQIPIAKGALAEPDRARLRSGDTDTPVQFSAGARWEDGSVRTLKVIFNVSVGPGERQSYQLQYGEGVVAAPPPRGLAVDRKADAGGIVVGNLTLSEKAGSLVASANYRSEFIGSGANGLSVVDSAGRRHAAGTAGPTAIEIDERGPLLVSVRYDYVIAMGPEDRVSARVTLDAPSSKSWLKASIVVSDPAKRLREIAFELPLAFAAFPWTWDFGTPNGTYGAFRNATDGATLIYSVPSRGTATWRVENGTSGDLRPYEVSAGARSLPVQGWAHIQDANKAVAFAIEEFGRAPGTYAVQLDGKGQTSFRFATLQPASEHRLTVYAHFVSTPVPIGAATSPASILAPLEVTISK